MSLASRFNLAYLSAGIYCEKQLKPVDSSACLNSMLQQHWRARTEEQACQLMKEYVDKWRDATRFFTEYSAFEDWTQESQCREEFVYNFVGKTFRSANESRTWSEQWLRNWIRSNSKPADIAQNYLSQRGDWFSDKQLTTDEILTLLDASGKVEPWDYDTQTAGEITFTDLSRHADNAILKAPTSLMEIIKRFPPFTRSVGGSAMWRKFCPR